MQKVILEGYPQVQISIFIVWLKMYAADSLDAVSKGSHLFQNDPRVTQFYDPEKLSGLEVAAGLGAISGEVAWDIYLFFDRQAEWVDRFPQPVDWVHQLRDSRWAGPERLFQGERLPLKLHEMMESFIP